MRLLPKLLGGQHDRDTQLQMTPMIDVVFQLLIFFLVGTKFRSLEGELNAYLPKEGAPTKPQKQETPVQEIHITLRVAQGGAGDPNVPPDVLIDDRSLGYGGDTMMLLRDRLQNLAQDEQFRQKVPIIIEAEPDVPYQWVLGALNLCHKARFEKVQFAASKRNAPLPAGAAAAP